MIIRRLNVKGGTQRQMLSLARELQKRGHDITIYTFAYSKENCYADLLEGLRVIVHASDSPMPYYPQGYIGNLWKESRESRTLALAMDKGFDILNPHDQVAYKVAHYYKKLVKDIPSVWNMNDVVSLRWGYDRLRGVDEEFHQPLYKQILYRLFDAYDNWKYIASQNMIITVDDFNRGLLKKYHGRENSVTVRNGPNLEHFAYKKRTAPQGRRMLLLTSGIFMPHRRFQDSMYAVAFLRGEGVDVSLTIIGDYNNDKKYYEKLAQLRNELQITDHVTFRGRVTEQELIDAYYSHDVYIWQHHLQSDGLSPFEAASCGLPIIVSRTSGCSETLTDRVNGLLIDPKKPQDIADRVKELATNPEFYEKLSAQGAQFVRGNFSWQKYTDGVLGVYKETIRSYNR